MTQIRNSNLTEFILAVEYENVEISEAYLRFINRDVKNPYAAAQRLEQSEQYITLSNYIASIRKVEIADKAEAAEMRFINLVNKTIDKVDKLLDDSDNEDPASRRKTIQLASDVIRNIKPSGQKQPQSIQPAGVQRRKAVITKGTGVAKLSSGNNE